MFQDRSYKLYKSSKKILITFLPLEWYFWLLRLLLPPHLVWNIKHRVKIFCETSQLLLWQPVFLILIDQEDFALESRRVHYTENPEENSGYLNTYLIVTLSKEMENFWCQSAGDIQHAPCFWVHIGFIFKLFNIIHLRW